jgi:hypothetical protein
MKFILSSGGLLTLLAVGALVFISGTVHTSDIERQHVDPVPASDQAATSIESNSASNGTRSSAGAELVGQVAGGGARQRAGRLYQPASQPIESYAAAYAATNPAGAGAEQSLATGGHHQQSVADQTATNHQAADSGAYASFGESVPQSITHHTPGSHLSNLEYPAHSAGYYANHYMAPSSNELSYSSGQPSAAFAGYQSASNQHVQHANHHHHYKSGGHQAPSLPYGYPSNVAYERSPLSSSSANYYADRGSYQTSGSSPLWSTGGFNSGFGLVSSASHALSHWTKSFSLSEIICGLVALTIGAIILGAPFFLIYLALMGNFSGSGTLSLTNPTSAGAATSGASTQVNGRRKRLAVFETMSMNERASKHPDLVALADSFVRELSPLVDLRQVSSTFKTLVRSIEKYSTSAYNDESKSAKLKSSSS